MIQVTLWSLPSLAALLLALATLRQVRLSSGLPGASALTALCLCSATWALGQLLGTLTTELHPKVLAAQFGYTGIALLPATWLLFAINYLRGRNMLSHWKLAALLAVPVATVVIAWTNSLHGLLWSRVTLQIADGFVGASFEHGSWFRVHLIVSYAMVLAATIILRFELWESPPHAKARAAVVQAPVAVILANLVHLSSWNPLPFIDPSALGLAVAIWILNRGFLRAGMLDLSPLLHRQVLEELRDPIIIIDRSGRIVEANASASQQLRGGAPLTGLAINAVIAHGALNALLDGAAESAEIPIGDRTWHVRATRLQAPATRNRKTVLVLRNITDRLEAENELRQVKQEMERLAHTDSLTGLANRRFFMQRLHEEIDRATRYRHPLSVLLLDLDLFKQINDTHGHDTGDRVLAAVAHTISRVKRTSDVAARVGGEEFALLLPATDLEGAGQLAERLRRDIAATHVEYASGERVSVTTSIGFAAIHERENDLDDLLVRADRALYCAKHEGRDRVVAATE